MQSGAEALAHVIQTGCDAVKRPTQPPTHECTFGIYNEVSCKNICFVLKEIGKVGSFTRRRSQVRVLSRPPLESAAYRQETQKQPTHLPTQIELLRASRIPILRPWQRVQSPPSIRPGRPHLARVPSANQSISMSAAWAGGCPGLMHPRAGSRRSNVAARVKCGLGSFISG
jgi:hypothetical protein